MAEMTAFTPTPETTRQLRDAYGRFATGVCIVTTHTPSGPIGMTANSFTSVSLDPPLVLWCPGKTSARTPHFTAASHFAIHVLCDEQAQIAKDFAKDGRAFSGIEITDGEGDVPLIANCAARFECETRQIHEAGDHLIQVGKVLRAMTSDKAPLIFCNGGFGDFSTG